MFSIYETRENREELLNKFLKVDPCVALVIAFLDFEWTIRRCILALGRSRTSVIRKKFSGELDINVYHIDKNPEQDKQEEKTKKYPVCGLDGYKKIWTKEVFPIRKISLFDLLKSRVKIRTIEGFDQDKFNQLKQNQCLKLKRKQSSIGNTDEFLKFVYDRFRNTLIHGIRTNVQDDNAKFVCKFIIACSGALCSYAEEQGESIYGRKILRRKTL